MKPCVLDFLEKNYKMKEELEIFNYLLGIGCCNPCCLRYITQRSADLENVDDYFYKVIQFHSKSSLLSTYVVFPLYRMVLRMNRLKKQHRKSLKLTHALCV